MQPRNHRNPKSRCWPWGGPSAAAIAGMVATVAIVAPARAAVLNTWTFDPTTHALTVTLPNSVTPDYFLLAQPARIVLDIPDTTLGTVQSAQTYSGAIRSIRLAEVQSGARIVIEFAPNTLLDPRHAELVATDIGNGQTQWTLRPLLQDAAATVATAPAAASTPSAPSSGDNPPAAVPPAPESAPSSPDLAPSPESGASQGTAPLSTANADPAALDAAAVSASADSTTPTSPVTPASTTDLEPSIPMVVSPAAELPEVVAETSAELPDLPDIAESATTGAVQALPSGADDQMGVRTDAAALSGIGNENIADMPPEQLPIDPFAANSQPTVSVPSLAEADRTPAPQVAVPSIAEVPEAPATASNSPATAPATTAAANQVRPPGAAIAPGSPPTSPDRASSAPAEPEVPAAAVPSATVTTARSIEIPTMPLPPGDWGDRAVANLEPNQVRPPGAEAIAQTPPAAATPPQPDPSVETNGASTPTETTADSVGLPSEPSLGPSPVDNSPPASPAPAAATMPPPPAAAEAGAADAAPAAPATLPPPPFLESEGAPSVEQPSIPPPPTVPQGDGTVPFGAPLPQSKALDERSALEPVNALMALPVGTRMMLQYSGSDPLVLADQAPTYEVLTVVGDIYGSDGELLLPAGTQVLGRFEGFDESGRRFVSQVVIREGDRRPLLAESEWLTGTPQPQNGENVAIGAGIGAVAATLLTGLSGFGIVGGAAAGAAAAAVESPRLVTVEPGQIIEVEVVSEILPFNDAPDITQQYR